MTIEQQMVIDLVLDYESRNRCKLPFIEMFYYVCTHYPEITLNDFRKAFDRLRGL